MLNVSVFMPIVTINKSKLRTIKNHEIFKVNYVLNGINEELNHVINDLLILSESHLLINYWKNSNQAPMQKLIESHYLNVITNNKIYDQIRLINNAGQELIRANYNKGKPEIVASNQLQNKKGRYYFEEALLLKKGNVYMSPMDLNIENGDIDKPFKPMIRLATPVYDHENKKRGIVIINYLAKHLLERLPNETDDLSETLLINSDGYFFKGFKADDEWLFMFPAKEQIKLKSYINNYQDSITQNQTFQFEHKSGLFTSKTLTFNEKHFSHYNNQKGFEHEIFNTEKRWHIVQFLSGKLLHKENNIRTFVSLLVLLVLNIGAILLFIRINKINKQKQQAFHELEKSQNKLKSIIATKDKLYSLLAHDLKNPFNSMLGFSEVLLRKYHKYDDNKRLELINIVSSGLNSTYQLLDNLLIWTKSQTSRFSFKPKEVTLHKLVLAVTDECAIQSNKKRIVIENTIPVNYIAFADYNLLTIVIRNLLSNAIKFSFENSKIKISAKQQNPACIICIEDFGTGIPKHVKDNLFNKVNNSLITTKGTDNESGTGLGLLLCQELIEIHKGKIWVESEIGKGSRFYISLPIS